MQFLVFKTEKRFAGLPCICFCSEEKSYKLAKQDLSSRCLRCSNNFPLPAFLRVFPLAAPLHVFLGAVQKRSVLLLGPRRASGSPKTRRRGQQLFSCSIGEKLPIVTQSGTRVHNKVSLGFPLFSLQKCRLLSGIIGDRDIVKLRFYFAHSQTTETPPVTPESFLAHDRMGNPNGMPFSSSEKAFQITPSCLITTRLFFSFSFCPSRK